MRFNTNIEKIDGEGLDKMKKQAEREGGQFLILSPEDGSAAALSALPQDLNAGNTDVSASKDKTKTDAVTENSEKRPLPLDANGDIDHSALDIEHAETNFTARTVMLPKARLKDGNLLSHPHNQQKCCGLV